jgi:hypothetical protein
MLRRWRAFLACRWGFASLSALSYRWDQSTGNLPQLMARLDQERACRSRQADFPAFVFLVFNSHEMGHAGLKRRGRHCISLSDRLRYLVMAPGAVTTSHNHPPGVLSCSCSGFAVDHDVSAFHLCCGLGSDCDCGPGCPWCPSPCGSYPGCGCGCDHHRAAFHACDGHGLGCDSAGADACPGPHHHGCHAPSAYSDCGLDACPGHGPCSCAVFCVVGLSPCVELIPWADPVLSPSLLSPSNLCRRRRRETASLTLRLSPHWLLLRREPLGAGPGRETWHPPRLL